MKNQKPYFSTSIIEAIVRVVVNELSADGKMLEIKEEEALRKYIQAPKHTYENAVLAGVAAGEYACTIQNGNEVAYKAIAASDEEIDSVIDAAIAKANRDADSALKADWGDDAGTEIPKKEAESLRQNVPTRGQISQVLTQKKAAKLAHALNMVVMFGKPRKLDL